MLALFRTISFPNFEQLHIIFGGAAGFTPLLPSVLNLLCAMLDGPNSAPLKSKIIEACLITPARQAVHHHSLSCEGLQLQANVEILPCHDFSFCLMY